MPIFLPAYGPSIAFGIPGALMFIATLVFWLARKQYVRVPPAPPNPDSFLNVVRTALVREAPGEGRPGLYVAITGVLLALVAFGFVGQIGFVAACCLALVFLMALVGGGAWMQLARARAVHPVEAVEGARAVLRVMIVFALITPFWSLFDQKASTWILQAD